MYYNKNNYGNQNNQKQDSPKFVAVSYVKKEEGRVIASSYVTHCWNFRVYNKGHELQLSCGLAGAKIVRLDNVELFNSKMAISSAFKFPFIIGNFPCEIYTGSKGEYDMKVDSEKFSYKLHMSNTDLQGNAGGFGNDFNQQNQGSYGMGSSNQNYNQKGNNMPFGQTQSYSQNSQNNNQGYQNNNQGYQNNNQGNQNNSQGNQSQNVDFNKGGDFNFESFKNTKGYNNFQAPQNSQPQNNFPNNPYGVQDSNSYGGQGSGSFGGQGSDSHGGQGSNMHNGQGQNQMQNNSYGGQASFGIPTDQMNPNKNNQWNGDDGNGDDEEPKKSWFKMPQAGDFVAKALDTVVEKFGGKKNPFDDVDEGPNAFGMRNRDDGQKDYNMNFNQGNNQGFANNAFDNFTAGSNQNNKLAGQNSSSDNNFSGFGNSYSGPLEEGNEQGYLKTKFEEVKEMDADDYKELAKNTGKTVVKGSKIVFEQLELAGKSLYKKYTGNTNQNVQGTYELNMDRRKDGFGLDESEIETTYGGTKKLQLNLKFDDTFKAPDALHDNYNQGNKGYYGVNDYGGVEGNNSANNFTLPSSYGNSNSNNQGMGNSNFNDFSNFGGSSQGNYNINNNSGQGNHNNYGSQNQGNFDSNVNQNKPQNSNNNFADFSNFNKNQNNNNTNTNLNSNGFLDFNAGTNNAPQNNNVNSQNNQNNGSINKQDFLSFGDSSNTNINNTQNKPKVEEIDIFAEIENTNNNANTNNLNNNNAVSNDNNPFDVFKTDNMTPQQMNAVTPFDF